MRLSYSVYKFQRGATCIILTVGRVGCFFLASQLTTVSLDSRTTKHIPDSYQHILLCMMTLTSNIQTLTVLCGPLELNSKARYVLPYKINGLTLFVHGDVILLN